MPSQRLSCNIHTQLNKSMYHLWGRYHCLFWCFCFKINCPLPCIQSWNDDDNLKGVGWGGGGEGDVPSDATHFLSSDLIHATRLLLNGKKLFVFLSELSTSSFWYWLVLPFIQGSMESGSIHYPDARQWVGGKPMVVGPLSPRIDSIFPRNRRQFIHKERISSTRSSKFYICMSLPIHWHVQCAVNALPCII